MECGYVGSTTQGVAKGVNSHVCILEIALVGTEKAPVMQVFVRVGWNENNTSSSSTVPRPSRHKCTGMMQQPNVA